MNVSPLGTVPPDVGSPKSGPEPYAQDLRLLSQAADKANSFQAAGAGREFSISIDRVSHEVVVRIVDSRTRDVIEQTPAAYLLQLRDYYSSLK
jgi:uncharacterized FlaG/YvyC family protein